MMLPTHALAGMALGVPLVFIAPEFAVAAFVGGFIGGVLPDLDMYMGHRKTFHFPIYLPAVALGATAIMLFRPTPEAVAAAFLLLGAGLHSVTDIIGGGLGIRPWEATSIHGVYNHHSQRWIGPRRWISYDGSPGDLFLSATLALILLLVVDGLLYWLVIGSLIVAIGYTVVRKHLPTLAESSYKSLLSRILPPSVLSFVPRRYRPTD